MKLYYAKGACSLVVRIILNEIDLKFDWESVDLKTKQTEHGNDFRLINPKGSVPALALQNGDILTENSVILQYLADKSDKTNLLPHTSDFRRYRILEWLNYITTELHKGFGPLFNPKVPQDIKDQIFVPILISKFTYLNNHLKKYPYLAGDHFTLPDSYLFVMLLWAINFKMDLTELTELTSYFVTLKTRKSIQLSLQQEEEH